MVASIKKASVNLCAAPLGYKLFVVYFLLAISLFGQGVYIKAKAQLAQVLLESAWQKQQQDSLPYKAWSWADGYPVAKISINNETPFIILAGASGSNLAFAPSWLVTSSDFNESGNSVVFAHNDTYFKGLEALNNESIIAIETAKAEQLRYQVKEIKVIHETNLSVLSQGDEDIVTLITCYPFDASIIHSDLRFVVIAKRIS